MSNAAKSKTFGFEAKVAGKRAECEGGGPTMGTHLASRQDFSGTLSGEYMQEGDPPWRWYLMTELTDKPEAYAQDSVWCEAGNIFLTDGDTDLPPVAGSV